MLSDALLLEGVRQGDQTSFEALFHRHYKQVYQLLYRLLGSRAEADELAQEVFIKLFRQPLRHGDNVSGWLYRVATNLAYNKLRTNRRRSQREETAMLDQARTVPSAASEAESNIIQSEVRAILAQLKPRQGQLLLLRQMGLSYKELGAALDVKPSSIGTLLARAEKAFRRVYERGRE